MKQLLKKFKQEKTVISIYNDPADTGNCWTGIVYAVDEDYVLLAHMTENGFYGGFCLHAIEEIFNIEQGTAYEKKTHKLYELRKQQHPTISLDLKNGLLDAVLSYAQNNKLFISFSFFEDDSYPPIGLIEDMTEEYLCLRSFRMNGEENGFSHIKKENIHQLFLDSLSEQNVALLYHDLNK